MTAQVVYHWRPLRIFHVIPDLQLLFDPALPFRLAVEIHRANASFFLWATAGIVAIWLASIADAWLCPPGRPAASPGKADPAR